MNPPPIAHAVLRPLPMSRIAVGVGGVVGIGAALFGHLYPDSIEPSTVAVAAVRVSGGDGSSSKTDPGLQAPTLAPAAAVSPLEPTPAPIPLSSVSVPSCEVLLGKGFVPKLDPAGALEQTQLGNREIVRGNLEAAELAFCSAALWDSTNVERWLNLSQLFLFRRDAAQAAESAEKALALQPDSPRALNAAGDAWGMQGSLERARGAFLKAEKLPPPNDKTLPQLIYRDLQDAGQSLSSHDVARAERIYRRVLAFAPDNLEASAGVATCLQKLGESEQAKPWSERAQVLRGL